MRRRAGPKKDFITCQECDEKVPFVDFIEQRLKSDPVARKILAMDETATRELDTQALEQILIGHMKAIAGEANQIFRPVTMFDHGIDGEVEFKDNDEEPRGAHPPSGAVYRALAEKPCGTKWLPGSRRGWVPRKLDARAHPATPEGGCAPPEFGVRVEFYIRVADYFATMRQRADGKQSFAFATIPTANPAPQAAGRRGW